MSIGRPLQFDENAALEKALDLFWSKGYSSTSLSDLCTTMGLSKSSLYATFKNKRSLFLRAIDMYVNGLVFELKKQKKDSGNAREFIEAVILSVVNEANPGIEKKGCLVMNSATEFAQTDKEIARVISASLDSMRFLFEETLARGIRSKTIQNNIDPKVFSQYLVSSIAGMKTMVKSGSSRDDLLNIAQIIINQL